MFNTIAKMKKKELVIGTITLTAAVIISICFILSEGIDTQAALAEPSYKYYTNIRVQKGDTLWDIAQLYITDDYRDVHDYIEEVCSINHITGDEIRDGQYITVPYYSNVYLK